MLVKIISSLHPNIKNDTFVYNVYVYFDIRDRKSKSV